jgi:glycosyltransferase involved in cell wall biosynthesis
MSNRRISILFVHHFGGMGGATMSLFYIIEKLDPEIFDIEVLFLSHRGEGIDYYKSHGIKVTTMDGVALYPHAENSRISFIGRNPIKPWTLFLDTNKSVKVLLPFFKEKQYDIVHLNTSLLLSVGKAAKLAGSKVVWHIREPLYQGILGIRKGIVSSWIKKYSDKILAITGVEASRLGASEKIEIVYNFVDFKKFDKSISGDQIRRELSISKNDFMVVNLGGTVHSKGADIFIKAAAILCAQYENIKFVLAGYAPTERRRQGINRLKKMFGLKRDLSQQVLDLIDKYSLQDRVRLTGMRTDIPEILSAADVLAWTATIPHFARPIIEANAMAKPVVASDFPSTREAVTDRVNGLLCEPNDATDLAEKIRALYLDRKAAHDLGQAGFKLASQKFNAQINFSKIQQAFFALCSHSFTTKSPNERSTS